MLGDNPKADIEGANRMGEGWNSILVHTGIYKPGDKLTGDEIPTFEVANMSAAVKLILEREKLSHLIKL